MNILEIADVLEKGGKVACTVEDAVIEAYKNEANDVIVRIVPLDGNDVREYAGGGYVGLRALIDGAGLEFHVVSDTEA